MTVDDEQIECFRCEWSGLVSEVYKHPLDPDSWFCPHCMTPVQLPEGEKA